MQNQFILMLSIALLLLVGSNFSCRDPIESNHNNKPFVSANIQNDSIYLEDGFNSYESITWVNDSLMYRSFGFSFIKNNHQFNSRFQISFNNFKNEKSTLENDLDHSIYSGLRQYQDQSDFIPLAVRIIWYDSSGIKFTSEGLVQSQLFSITSVEDIIFDCKKYKKTHVVFNCNLNDGNGNTINVTDGKGTLLFGGD